MKPYPRLKIFVSIFLAVIFTLPALPVRAADKTGQLSFTEFAQGVTNGQARVVRGVYVPGVLAFPVVQQPANNPGFVSARTDTVTQFGMADAYHVIGLLAHNTEAGAAFGALNPGEVVSVVYGDGQVTEYIVSQIVRYQALQPNSLSTYLLNLDDQTVDSAQSVFNRFYTGGDHVTFQTCIEQDGLDSWGRMFIVAVPLATLFPPRSRILSATLQS